MLVPLLMLAGAAGVIYAIKSGREEGAEASPDALSSEEPHAAGKPAKTPLIRFNTLNKPRPKRDGKFEAMQANIAKQKIAAAKQTLTEVKDAIDNKLD